MRQGLIVVFLAASGVLAGATPSQAETAVLPPGGSRHIAMDRRETAGFVGIAWQPAGTATTIALMPLANASAHDSLAELDADAGTAREAERHGLPLSALDAYWRSLVLSTGAFREARPPALRVALRISDYQPRYLGNDTGWLSSAWAWGKANLGLGGEEPAKAALQLFVYRGQEQQPSLSLEVRGELRDCDTVAELPIVATGRDSAFLGRYGQTAIGQTVFALMNRALAELVAAISPAAYSGQVLERRAGGVTVDLPAARIGEQLNLLSREPSPTVIGHLLVTGGEPGRYQAVPRDLPLDAIVPGDTLAREQMAPHTVYTRLSNPVSRCDIPAETAATKETPDE